VGVRNLVEAGIDFSLSRNVFVASLVLVGIALNALLSSKLGVKVKSVHGNDKL